MRIKILKESGYDEALLGLSLSYNKDAKEMINVSKKLCFKNNGENKFLEFIQVWLDITAPRYWWQQFDAYRLRSEQSESTMHTIMKKKLTQEDFEGKIRQEFLNHINKDIEDNKFEDVKNELPEGFLQRRIICINYKSLGNIIYQRKNHRLSQWHKFIKALDSLEHADLIIKKESPKEIFSDLQLAKTGYEAFGEYCQWKDQQGNPIPSWEKLGNTVNNWYQVARAIREKIK